jgi:hypothetical protein
MKTYTVKSIRKNPDRYIKSLKSVIKSLEKLNDNLRAIWIKERGKHITRYRAGERSGVSEISMFRAREFRVGDRVIVEGEVTEIKKQGSGYCVYWTSEEVRVKPLD